MTPEERIAALEKRVAELEAELKPYQEAEALAIRQADARMRVEQISGLLFPRFSAVAARSDPSVKPPQWHEKSWWWNGVTVNWDKSDLDLDGGTANFSSYVGGGEVEDIDLAIPKAWIDAPEDQWRGMVSAFRDGCVKKRSEAKVAREAAEAQRQIQAAQETLRRLGAA